MIQNILMVALGLGFVIFFHELGHFLLAKWNGVKVEKFSIGFDLYGLKLWSFQRGETTYVLGAIPLGGYVKMLGENPDEQAATSTDPRSYGNKSVGARMAIISAGVIMNLILGMACFVLAFSLGGLMDIPPKLGMVVAGRPAYEAGVRTGDRIVAIDGKQDITYEDLLRAVALSGNGQFVRLDLKRPGQDALVSVKIEPGREASAERPSIGIGPINDLVLAPEDWFVPPLGLSDKVPMPGGGFKGEDRIVQVGPVDQEPEDVADAIDLHRVLSKYRDKRLNLVVERGGNPKTRSAGGVTKATLPLPPNHFVDFGFRLKIEPISSIQGGSIAQTAGFQKGDLIVKVDGQDDFDPMRLPTYFYDHAGKPVTVELERGEGEAKAVTITVTPDDSPPWLEAVMNLEPLEIPGLGLAYPVATSIVAVREGSPAAKAGLKRGDVIKAMTLNFPRPKRKEPTPFTFKFDGKDRAWPQAFSVLQDPTYLAYENPPSPDIELLINNATQPIVVRPEPDPDWFHPARGLRFEVVKQPVPPQNLASAFQRGAEVTFENAISIYYMIRGLVQERLGKENFGGPIRIAGLAYHFASSGFSPFVYFLGLLSVNLAVLNFLPIPPLDGGQMAFLVAEKIRGRPLPESAQMVGTIAGLVFVLGLMLFFVYQDVKLTFF
jgi:regulator of sigma E protease